jgi:hypothetical protein
MAFEGEKDLISTAPKEVGWCRIICAGQNGNPDREGRQVKKTYRLNQEIQATVAGVEHRAFVTIPQGSIISIIGPVAEEPEFADVLWDGQTARTFACDLTARTTAITTKKPKVTTPSGGNTNSTPPKSEGNPTTASDPPVKVRRFTASGREL